MTIRMTARGENKNQFSLTARSGSPYIRNRVQTDKCKGGQRAADESGGHSDHGLRPPRRRLRAGRDPPPKTEAKPTEAPKAAAPVAAQPTAAPTAAKPVAPPATAAPAAAAPPKVDTKAIEDFYKGKTVRIVVGFAAGGGYDTYARAMARYMGKHIPGNPSIVVENQVGA